MCNNGVDSRAFYSWFYEEPLQVCDGELPWQSLDAGWWNVVEVACQLWQLPNSAGDARLHNNQ